MKSIFNNYYLAFVVLILPLHSYAQEWQNASGPITNVPAKESANGFLDIGAKNSTNEASSLGESSPPVDSGSEDHSTYAQPQPNTNVAPRFDYGPKVRGIGKYNLFGGAPPVPGTRRIMADGEAPEDYIVQPGDTLYDIGAQLLDEPGYWPKLWALNPEIPNPHFIYPGMHLRFYPGDDDNPPFLEVITEDDVIPIDKQDLEESELVVKDISKLLLEMDDETNVPVGDANELGLADFDLDFRGEIWDSNKLHVVIPAFVFEDDDQAVGTVMIGPGGKSVLSDGDRIMIDGTLQPGTQYTIVREGEEVASIDREGDDTHLGYRYDYVATVLIQKALEDGNALGIISNSQLGATTGDLVIPYRNVNHTVTLDAPAVQSSKTHSVVGFTHVRGFTGGRGDFVLLDQVNGQIPLGQTVRIFQPFKKASLFYDLESFSDLGEAVGDVQIVENSSLVAIGYCIDNIRELRIGDLTTPPEYIPSDDEP